MTFSRSFVLLALLGSVLSLSSCGKSDSDSRTYSYEENGCKTGSHSADSLEAYCANLKNDELNNGCAYGLRKNSFDRDCGGSGVTWNADVANTDVSDETVAN